MNKEIRDLSIILASSSPRRKELLGSLGFTLKILNPDFEEQKKTEEDPHEYVKRNAQSKGKSVLKALTKKSDIPCPCVLISADTIVLLQNEILEKPKNEDDASLMLSKLSGQTHRVISGVYCSFVESDFSKEKSKTFTVETDVEMKVLSKNEIESYIATREPLDKAGSYAIQGKGAYMVKRISGSYSNVVGLPLTELIETIEEFQQLF